MKVSTLFKYIFIIFVISIVIYAGYKIYANKNKTSEIENVTENNVDEVTIKDLRLGISNFDTMNPLITNNKEILNIDTMIFEPLFSITKDYKLEPCLATEWSKTGDNTYVIKVDSTVKWQDGSYFTAKDVKFTIDRLKEGNSVYKDNVSHVTSVEVVDASTVKITVDQAVPFFEYNLTFPIMSDLYYFNDNFYTSTKIPIGTGRFKISDVSSTSITLSKNTDWKKINSDESKLDTIKINLYSSMGEVFNSFKLGNIDMLNTSNMDYQNYVGTIGFKSTESAGREFDFLSLNCKDDILQDKYVRQAISYAIDKNNIISAVYNNQKIVSNYPLDYGNYLNISDSNSSGYNADQAKKILENGGWTYANNRWISSVDGQTLRLKLSVCKDNENRVKVANAIKDQLGSIGVEVTVNEVSSSKYQDYLSNKDYQMLLTGIYNSYTPDITYFFADGNIENYYNDDVISVLASGLSTKNEKSLSEGYKKIYDIYKDEVPFIGLYRNKNLTISSNSMVGDITANNYSTFYSISSWYRR